MYTIVSLSDSDKHFSSALAEYTKRMQKNLTLIDLKPSKADHRATAISNDTKILLERCGKNKKNYDTLVLLSILWNDKATEVRVRNFPFEKNICFIIGWPHGLDEDLLKATYKDLQFISLGKQTMVHGLAKLAVAEQIYRIRMIQHNRNYHY